MKKHLFHLVSPSPWPLIISIGAFFFTTGLAFCMHRIGLGGYICLVGVAILALASFFWFRDIVEEASYAGFHTRVVKKGLTSGFYLFIVSEVMLFFGFFWAFFHSSLSPAVIFGTVWPPAGIVTINVFAFPLFNTILLIISGFSITWAHRATSLGSYGDVIDSLLITMFLGFTFVFLQGLEYFEAAFNLDDGIYSCTFYMLTGLHGCHVLVGASFIFVCFVRFLRKNFTTSHYLGFVFAIWYWHFVDAVWIFLFLTVYGWGSW